MFFASCKKGQPCSGAPYSTTIIVVSCPARCPHCFGAAGPSLDYGVEGVIIIASDDKTKKSCFHGCRHTPCSSILLGKHSYYWISHHSKPWSPHPANYQQYEGETFHPTSRSRIGTNSIHLLHGKEVPSIRSINGKEDQGKTNTRSLHLSLPGKDLLKK